MKLSKIVFISIFSILITLIDQANSEVIFLDKPSILIGKALPKDTDGDGVDDSIDKCPNTLKNVIVDKNGCPISDLPDDQKLELLIFFEKNKYYIQDQYKFKVANLAKKMRKYPNLVVKIEGYASDNTKYDIENLILSTKRANAVKLMLINEFGIEPNRFSTIGYNKKFLVNSENSYVENELNRSVYAVTIEKGKVILDQNVSSNPYEKKPDMIAVPFNQ